MGFGEHRESLASHGSNWNFFSSWSGPPSFEPETRTSMGRVCRTIKMAPTYNKNNWFSVDCFCTRNE